MDKQEGLVANRAPIFIGDNYVFWSVRMKCHLMSLGCRIWNYVEKWYKIPDNLPTNIDELYEYESNTKSLNAILKGLPNLVFVKVMQCKTTEHAWEKIKIDYKGASKVKKSKLQTYKGKFKILKMKEEENIAEYLQRVDEIVNAIRSLEGEIKEK